MERKKHKKLKKTNGHTITAVLPGSIAEELELVPGDILLSLQGREVADVFDYRYLIEDTYLVAEIQKENGEIWELEIEKDYEVSVSGESLGVMKTNLGGKLTFSVEADENEKKDVKICEK